MATTEHFLMETLSPLYEDVQMAALFEDSKYFVDAVPKSSSETILTAYEKEKKKPGFDLKQFVHSYFILPQEADNSYRSSNKPLKEHLSGLWDVLTRQPAEASGSLLPLPHPYIVPGGRFREVYYWDSYFTMLGLQLSGRMDMVENMINNFAYQIDQIGFIPNGNRSYYLGRSQPPFFALMLTILMEEKGEAVLLQYQSQLEKEYAFWMDGETNLSETNKAYRRVVRMPDGAVLNRYWDDNAAPRPEAYIEDVQLAAKSGRVPEDIYRDIRAAAESGWDFSSRWFANPQDMATIQTTRLVPVDLNCLILFMETVLSAIYQQNDPEKFNLMLGRAEKRKKAIQDFCWNETAGFYFDAYFETGKQSAAYTLAALYPLFISIADYPQSVKVAAIVEDKFLQQGGLLTTLSPTKQQWDAPNGWAPLQWVAFKGLNRVPYLHCDLAQKIRTAWMQTNERIYAETGKMMEKYNVSESGTNAAGGEYPNQDGFGWTNGVYLKFLML
jgi:alpha,alpha-trehalase